MSRNIIGIAILGLVLVAALALPASAAAANGNGNGNAYGKVGKIDPALKSDLWTTYAKYRLQVYDTRVEGANAIVSVLGNHGCPTSDLSATATAIGDERSALSDALTNQDRKALQTVNQDLVKLWTQFRDQAKASIKACSAQPGASTSTTDTTAAEV